VNYLELFVIDIISTCVALLWKQLSPLHCYVNKTHQKNGSN